jgi:Cu-Zn family superoxide dismutase
MKHVSFAIGFSLCAAIGPAIVSGQSPATSQPSGMSSVNATAKLADANGRSVGEALLQQTPHGVLIRVELRDVSPGVHALHIHEVGRCDAPSFESAGPHFAPSGQKHGFLHRDGPHAGDLPNVAVPSTKQETVEHFVAGVTLDAGPRSLLDANGSAIVIHARQDDYTSDPAGNAGDRIACGRIVQ